MNQSPHQKDGINVSVNFSIASCLAFGYMNLTTRNFKSYNNGITSDYDYTLVQHFFMLPFITVVTQRTYIETSIKPPSKDNSFFIN
jgi:hypothetical protein